MSDLDGPPADVKAAVRAASGRDNWRNALYLAADWLVAGVAALVHLRWGGVLLYLVTLAVLGTRMRALANLLHESSHYKLFANRRANRVVGRVLCAWPILVNYDRYIEQHRLHHRNLWRDNDDPDVGLYRLSDTEYASAGRMSYRHFLVRHVLLVVLPVQPLRRLAQDGSPWRLAARLASVLALVALCWYLSPALGAGLLLYWLLPWLTSYQMVSYWAELGEHGGLRARGWEWGTRNWSGNLLSRWAIGSHSDDLYHLLHHWFPSVPHYRLRDVDAICMRAWPRYCAEARCSGFFLGSADGVSVLRDIWTGGTPVPVPRQEDAVAPVLSGRR